MCPRLILNSLEKLQLLVPLSAGTAGMCYHGQFMPQSKGSTQDGQALPTEQHPQIAPTSSLSPFRIIHILKT